MDARDSQRILRLARELLARGECRGWSAALFEARRRILGR
jgi:hypothetical protein